VLQTLWNLTMNLWTSVTLTMPNEGQMFINLFINTSQKYEYCMTKLQRYKNKTFVCIMLNDGDKCQFYYESHALNKLGRSLLCNKSCE
jgi:hypothetical protein